MHLGNVPENQYFDYINSLNFDPYGENDGKLGRRLKRVVEKASSATVYCHGGARLSYDTSMVSLSDYVNCLFYYE